MEFLTSPSTMKASPSHFVKDKVTDSSIMSSEGPPDS
jgi:hypothetical protein